MKKHLTAYFMQHSQAIVSSLGALWRSPFSSTMTLLVIAIALALPAGLYVFVNNMQVLAKTWQNTAHLSLFVHDNVTDEEARVLSQEIMTYAGISKVDFLTKDEAFAEFKNLSGFSEALEILPDNPLPPVIIVYPSISSPELLQNLQQELQQLPEVERVQLDLAWVQRLSALLNLGENIVWILMLFLSVAVVLIIGNTIRMAILNRQEEIAVMKLVGGTHAFIRRPFLYTGVWYGFLGAILALIMVSGALLALNTSVTLLASTYQSDFKLLGLGLARGVDLLLLGIILGWLGATLFVHYHLRRIEPR
jgi:cell division transport system permease protein